MNGLFALLLLFFGLLAAVNSQTIIEAPELGCKIYPHKHKVKQFDSRGLACSGEVTVLICRGRCDSKEISDWKFPYKRAFHPVCLHQDKVSRIIRLTECDPHVEPGTEVYEYVEAQSCKCQVCSSDRANCLGHTPDAVTHSIVMPIKRIFF